MLRVASISLALDADIVKGHSEMKQELKSKHSSPKGSLLLLLLENKRGCSASYQHEG